MILARIYLTFFVLLIFTCSCGNNPSVKGYIFYGQNGNGFVFDGASKKSYPIPKLSGCDEIASDPMENYFTFACNDEKSRELKTFSLSADSIQPTSVKGIAGLSDPALSPDGSRTLFRTIRSGDVYDLSLLFRGAGSVTMLRSIGAATFGLDNQSLFLSQGKDLAAHVVEDITHPEALPEKGLIALVHGPGVIRDIHFHLGAKRILICSGTQILSYDLTGRDKKILFDTVDAELPGPLLVPYRARYSFDANHVAAIVSEDGKNGVFLFVDEKGSKPILLKGPNPKVGGFTWTAKMPGFFQP